MTRVLVLGVSGMLGHRVWLELRERFEAWATVRGDRPGTSELLAGGRILTAAAEDFPSVIDALDVARPDAVVNCVGIVKQRPEARDPLASIRVNSLFPHELADICAARGVRLLHVSTDCVFSGHGGAYRETDLPDPTDLYGRSKLLGEVTGSGCLTLRTSIIGRELSGARGLLEWFLAQEGTAPGYTRAIFSGLTTGALASLMGDVLEAGEPAEGLWHVGSSPIAKHDLLVILAAAFGHEVEIVPDDSVEIDRSLDSSSFRAATGWSAQSWEDMAADLAADPLRYEELRNTHAH